MTRKVAKRIVKGITDKIECNTADIDDWAEFWGFTREEYEEFLDMPIKALEQEPILDQISEIIEPLRHLPIGEMSDIEWDILRVVDKYKGESEK